MDKFDKLKIASSSFGERLKTGGAQMSRIVSTKVKGLLSGPTPESKMVDDATLETMDESNWGLNLRICAMINNEEINGTEIVKAIKKKLLGKSVISQRLSLDLLEACTSNCDKVSSEVASEKVLDEMVKMIEDPKTDHGNRVRTTQLIRAWGESEELRYLPVFSQTYENLKTRGINPETPGNVDPYFVQQPLSPAETYPIPDMDSRDEETISYDGYGIEEYQQMERLLMTRHNIDILSSILNSKAEPKPLKEELTVSVYEKCKDYIPFVQNIIQSTTDDEVLLSDALNLHDELLQVTSRYDEMVTALEPGLPKNAEAAEEQQEGYQSDTREAKSPPQVETRGATEGTEDLKEDRTASSSETKSTGTMVKEI